MIFMFDAFYKETLVIFIIDFLLLVNFYYNILIMYGQEESLIIVLFSFQS